MSKSKQVLQPTVSISDGFCRRILSFFFLVFLFTTTTKSLYWCPILHQFRLWMKYYVNVSFCPFTATINGFLFLLIMTSLFITGKLVNIIKWFLWYIHGVFFRRLQHFPAILCLKLAFFSSNPCYCYCLLQFVCPKPTAMFMDWIVRLTWQKKCSFGEVCAINFTKLLCHIIM